MFCERLAKIGDLGEVTKVRQRFKGFYPNLSEGSLAHPTRHSTDVVMRDVNACEIDRKLL